ncbi:MAG: putative GTP-binding protein engB [uncultured bacterium (gcode 4)]|uniref:Putative GTP-binding protein engB n=1 Tax=uncultured bacterium (gcode 4) TaxID=1234023 RepID=K2G895_9BACT|nr:MAG: putative GTP-binding protein engB [uncultured bacterium (gcode 4)]
MEIKEVKFLTSVTELKAEIFPLKNVNTRKQVLFLGRSNVWKSSMINSLFWKKDLAYSSAKAWKTRTINIFEVNKTHACLDFPGYWYARWDKEERLVLRDMILDYLERNLSEKIKVIIVIDAYVWPTKLDKEIFDYVNDKKADILLVLNKADKANQKEMQASIRKIETELNNTSYIYYSCKNNVYKDNALKEIFKD